MLTWSGRIGKEHKRQERKCVFCVCLSVLLHWLLCEHNVTKTHISLRKKYYIINLTHYTYGHWFTNHVCHETEAYTTVWSE